MLSVLAPAASQESKVPVVCALLKLWHNVQALWCVWPNAGMHELLAIAAANPLPLGHLRKISYDPNKSMRACKE